MRSAQRSSRARLMALLAVVVTAAALVAGCGSSSSNSASAGSSSGGSATAASDSSGSSSSGGSASSAVAQAQKLIAPFLKRPTTIPVSAPINKPVPHNKAIDFLTCQSQGCVVIANDFKKVASQLNWTTKVITVAATSNAIQVAYDQVLRDNPDGVVTVGISSTGVTAQQKKLSAAKIPVVAVQDPDTPHPPYVATILNHNTSLPEGRDTAALAVAHGCTGTILYFQLEGFVVLHYTLQGFKQEYSKLLPDSSVKVVDIPATSLSNAAPTIVGAARANPDAKCIVLSQDDMAIGLPQALKAAGINDAKIIDLGPGSKITDQYFQNGQIDAIVISPSLGDWGYLMTDALARAFVGQSSEPDTKAVLVPWITTGNSVASSSDFAEVANIQAQYQKLWK